MLFQADPPLPAIERRLKQAEKASLVKLVAMHAPTKIATVECPCGGQTLIPTVEASEQAPRLGWCPRCDREFRYPNDLET